MVTVYIMACENNKYYVGKTNNITSRMEDHYKGYGSDFTKKYKPIKMVESIEKADIFEEDKQVKKYMILYGIDNVRGGSYSTIVLPEYQMKALEKEILSINNRCYKCQEEGHYVKQCDMIMIEKLKKIIEEKDRRIDELEKMIKPEMKYDEEIDIDAIEMFEKIYKWCYDNSNYMTLYLMEKDRGDYYYFCNRKVQEEKINKKCYDIIINEIIERKKCMIIGNKDKYIIYGKPTIGNVILNKCDIDLMRKEIEQL
jgi:hypothetical protein